MSFSRFLHENRTLHIDHRESAPARPGTPLIDTNDRATTGSRTRNRRHKAAHRSFREVKPAFAPLPFADPLPYVEPHERL